MDQQTKHRVTAARMRLDEFEAALPAREEADEALLRVHALLIARALQVLRPANGQEDTWAATIEAVGFTPAQAATWVQFLKEVDDHLVDLVQPLLALPRVDRATVADALAELIATDRVHETTWADFPITELQRVAGVQSALFGVLVDHRIQAQLKANNVARVLAAVRAGAWSQFYRLEEDRATAAALPSAELAHALNERLALWCRKLIVGQFPIGEKTFLLVRSALSPLAQGRLDDLVEALVEDEEDPGLWHLAVGALDAFASHHLTTLQALENNRTVGIAPFGESDGEDRLAPPALISPAIAPG